MRNNLHSNSKAILKTIIIRCAVEIDAIEVSYRSQLNYMIPPKSCPPHSPFSNMLIQHTLLPQCIFRTGQGDQRSGLFGGGGGKEHTFRLYEGERSVRIEGKVANVVERLQFFTNMNRKCLSLSN